MNLCYHLDVQSGTTIVLVAATLFAAVFVATGVTGPTIGKCEKRASTPDRSRTLRHLAAETA